MRWTGSPGCGMRRRSFLASFHFSRNVSFQSIEPKIPELAVVIEPGGGLLQGAGFESANMLTPPDLAAQQTCSLEHHNVLGNGVQGDREGLGNLGDGGRFPRQRLKDGTPRGIGHCGKYLVERLP